MNKFLYLILIAVFLGMPLCAQGQENAASDVGGTNTQVTQEEVPDEGQGAEGEYQADEVIPRQEYILAPEINTWLGARVVSVDGSKRAVQYGWPFSSAAGGFKLHYSPLPHRLDAELDWLNLYDNQAELSYAYKDIVKLTYLGTGMWHNLPHFTPTHSPAATTGAIDLNPTAGYHVDIRDDRVAMRFKWPERPYHVFTEFREIEKEGTIQQRFYALLSGTTSGKFAESRDIDWITRNYVVGINGHLGPLEAEYSHRTKTFDPHGEVKLDDLFNVGIAPDNNPGTIPVNHQYPGAHNVVPELENNYDTLRVHTNLTGRIVGAVTLTTGSKDNEHSGAHADFNRASGDLTLKPMDKMTIAIRYRYCGIQVDSPRFVVDPGYPAGFGIPPSSTLRATKDSIDRITNRADVVIRYVPYPAVALKLEYDFLSVVRSNTNQWSDPAVLMFQAIPEDQNIHTVRAGVDLRPFRTLNLKASASYVYTSDPAYPTMPQNQYNGKLDANWNPVASVNATAYYRLTRESNNTSNMRGYKDNAGALVSWSPMDRLSVYGNYDYSRYHKISEVNFGFGSGTKLSDNVPYTDRSNLYSLGVGYGFAFPLTLNSEFHQSWSKGRFRTDVTNGIRFSSYIGPLTDLNVRETGGSIKASYDFGRGWGSSVNYAINDYQVLNKPQDGPQDGTAHTVMLIVSRKW